MIWARSWPYALYDQLLPLLPCEAFISYVTHDTFQFHQPV